MTLSTTRSANLVFATAAAMAFVTAFSSTATADVAIAVDVDYAAPIKLASVSPGYGFGVRVGTQLHAPFFVLTPEVGVARHALGGDGGPRLDRVIAGLRLGLGEILRPGVYGHVGHGALSADSVRSHSSLTYDFGGFLDFTVLPLVNLGVHAGYTQWTGGDQSAFQFATAGAHAALVF